VLDGNVYFHDTYDSLYIRGNENTMSAWEIISEEASIVLVGNFNPKIFHPEWFIRKGIVEEWDYSKDDVVNVPDLAQFTLSSNRKVTVLLNKFSLRSSLASDHLALKDFVTSTFSFLRETPIQQMGMNYTSVIKIEDKDKWRQFGSELAPKKHWEQAADFIKDLDEEKQEVFGLWEMTMHLPRPDELPGHIRPKIAVNSTPEHKLSFSINNHVEIDQSAAMTMVKILEDTWEKSLGLANDLTSKIMDSQLGRVK